MWTSGMAEFSIRMCQWNQLAQAFECPTSPGFCILLLRSPRWRNTLVGVNYSFSDKGVDSSFLGCDSALQSRNLYVVWMEGSWAQCRWPGIQTLSRTDWVWPCPVVPSRGPVCVILTDSNWNVGVTVQLEPCIGRIEDSMHLLIGDPRCLPPGVIS